ncbi:MAG TPA: hypothetical protein VF477_14675, partial [Mycobacterium sp.]
VDAKVDAVLDIDDRTSPQRAEWLAAAQAVTTGTGDRAAASELVDQQIKPFVDNDIRSDWLAAMHRAAMSTTAAYDAAGARLDSGAAPTFGVPGELGPRWEAAAPAASVPVASVPAASVPAATVPAAAVMSSPAPAAAAPAFDPPATAPAPAPVAEPPPAAPVSPMPSLGEMGGGMPSLGTGASGFGQQLADLIGGLAGSSDASLPDPLEPDPDDEIDEPEEPEESEEDPEEVADERPVPPEEPEPQPAPPEPAVTPVPPPPEPPIPPAVPEALPVEPTPCEIAADELPQVGE